ncbi:MAG: NUDIX domain-containing protein [Acholeplasmataceae bacterium]|nr:NUDIX domain-containing protein [Acholeplasmataceae bacterium]
MLLIKEMMHKQNINIQGKSIEREAVRGVILKHHELLMIHSTKNNDYKFPGGGINFGETHEDALIREISEECGATVTKIDDELGKVIEYDIPLEDDYDVFKMTSFYYLCQVDSNFGNQSLDLYEKELGFNPVWINIDEAISANLKLINSNYHPRWVKRELVVLNYIKDKLK